MKKIHSLQLAAIFVGLSVFGAAVAEERRDEWQYRPELMRAFWSAEVMESEPILFVRDTETGESRGAVLFPVDDVIAVRNSAGDIVYQEGVDYRFEKGTRELVVPSGSRIITVSPDDLRRPANSQRHRLTHRDGKGEILFGAKLEYHQMQTQVTYRKSNSQWPLEAPSFDSGALPTTLGKLRRGESVSIVLLGDSISTGCNASSWGGGAPFQPAYQDLLVEHLRHHYRSKVELKNLSVGGKSTPWGITMVDSVVESDPDLVILAFGMNDSAGRTAEEYGNNIAQIIAKTRASSPNTEFILIASMLGNRDWTLLNHDVFPNYRDQLAAICGDGVALADMTSVWNEFLNRKKDADLTGNGVNHPNDFGHRVYAQVLSARLIDDGAGTKSGLTGQLIFPLESWHNHGSCLVECPNGDLLACWFHGSGERKSDDVEILGARLAQGTRRWSDPFSMADTPGFPDTNCCMIIDQNKNLWLLWPTIQANLWESALMKYKTSNQYMMPGPPKWDTMRVMHVKHPGDFPQQVKRKAVEYVKDVEPAPLIQRWMEHLDQQANDKLTRRIGWFTRAHPLLLDDGRMLVGLYSDGFSFSLVGITDDLGKTWTFSEPIVGGGNIQPSFARRRDGTIVAYMRDNGPPPNRILVSESHDRGETWSKVTDHPQLHNPGSGLELMRARNGDWLCIYNDLPEGRHSLAVSLSNDEGRTWKWTRHLEQGTPGEGAFHYPSIIEGSDGNFHATYSYFVEKGEVGQPKGKSIRYVKFDREWVKGHQ